MGMWIRHKGTDDVLPFVGSPWVLVGAPSYSRWARFSGCILSTGKRLERISQAFRVDAATRLLLAFGPCLSFPRAHQSGWWDLFHLHARQKVMAPPAQRESNSNGNLERRGKLKRVTREESQAWHVVSALAAGVPQVCV